MKKGLISLILIFILLMTGCGKKQPVVEARIYPEISIMTIGNADEHRLKEVSEALSVITKERCGCTVRLIQVTQGKYDSQIDNLLLESDFADIFICENRGTLSKLLSGSYIYRLDRFLKNYPEFGQAVTADKFWEAVKSDGYTYGIPMGNDDEYKWGFVMDSSILRTLEIDKETINTLGDIHDVLVKVKEQYPTMTPAAFDANGTDVFASWELIKNSGGCILTEAGEVKNICEMGEFVKRAEVFYTWNREGLVGEKNPFDTNTLVEWIKDNQAFGGFVKADKYTVREMEYQIGRSLTFIPLDETYYGDAGRDACFVISAHTQDVNMCLNVLKQIYTDELFLRKCIYGIEGEDYRAENGAAISLGSGYMNYNWALKDMTLAPVYAKDPDWVGTGDRCSLIFDVTNVYGQVYQCGKILEKYYEAICSGRLGIEAIDIMKSELDEVNMSKIKAEVEKQSKNSNK